MDKLIKFLKAIFLVVGIFVGLAVLAILYFVFMGVRSGDLETYVQKTAIETVIDEEKLTPTQQQLLEEGDYEGLAEDMQENVTPEQVDCAVQAVGEERARELVEMKNPTPQEILKLSNCL